MPGHSLECPGIPAALQKEWEGNRKINYLLETFFTKTILCYSEPPFHVIVSELQDLPYMAKSDFITTVEIS
ncbi:hypothetical protein DUI87_29042 [Hirundo rustica rustica]|uniref:Uncharacterized protein n=1 Tax=Hirundo rustica rustica TaxID=333673 RepID=A0A3M0JHK0_HIRRU|nr:hypothetical protein DUI87_29042 [Hirundo rustica rustica]